MRGLKIEQGDLVLSGGAYAEVTGAQKVAQDLRLALVEPLGTDRFHPGWGSRLSDFIGHPLTEAVRFDVQQEAARVVGNYVSVQRDKIQADVAADRKSRYLTADILTAVDSVQATSVQDVVQVQVRVRTGAGQSVSVTAAAGG